MTAPSAIPATGSAAPDVVPRSPKQVPHRGGDASPTAAALQARFPSAVERIDVVWGETTVVLARDAVHDAVSWLHTDAAQRYDLLADVTAVEFRDPEQPIEVVWHLRSLPYRRFLRLKTLLAKGRPLEVPSVWDIYKSADWLERECFDMFGVRFVGHPDLRRILMWERYTEGYPLRKDFPLRGRFSRAEQLRQALSANPEARYSMEELSIANAYEDLSVEMRNRLSGGERAGE